MTMKNKVIFKRVLSMLIPIILVVGVSCFFFVNVEWDKYTHEMWRQMIMTWIISYGGIVLLFVKAILTIISAKKVLSNKPTTINETINGVTTTLVTKKQVRKIPKNASKPYVSMNNIDVYKEKGAITIVYDGEIDAVSEYKELRKVLLEIVEHIRKDMPTQLI